MTFLLINVHFYRKRALLICVAIFMQGFCLMAPSDSEAKKRIPCRNQIKSTDSFLVATPEGKVIFEKDATKQRIPASTLKVLTALAVLDHFGPLHQFRTEFYMDSASDLKIKGYGDPLLISEVLSQISMILTRKTGSFRNIILDNTYFSSQIKIPGCQNTTNPYDAPIGALCANFNTAAFKRKKNGRIYSTEKQTPMIPFMEKKIRALGLKSGRRTFTHNSKEAALYVGELLRYMLKKNGVKTQGEVHFGSVSPEDTLIFTYRSTFPMETVVEKMLHSSSNFMANQVFVALGASVYGPPGTLAKGVRATQAYIQKELGLKHIKIVEGSGLSRKNHLSAYDMLAILEKFKPYKALLKNQGQVFYKTGSLRGIRAKVGYIESQRLGPCSFAIFFNRGKSNMRAMIRCLKKAVNQAADRQAGMIKIHPRHDVPSF
ncbi:MAG: D-alanyl-D-alanine carboxypeptidase [Deltaproteobacteria bacterium]|nr:D-alanyl-D-alanine carboxypeptidase [Deltaproteobacteria bacterium]